MARAAQEGLRPGIPLLEHGDLIDARLKEFGIQDPGQIPVHPMVYRSPASYTQEFSNEVWASIPGSIRADLTVIEAKIGAKLPVSIDDSGIRWLGRDYLNEGDVEFDQFIIEADSSGSIWVIDDESIAINIGLDISRPDMQLIDVPHPMHPMPKDKLRKYMVNPKKFDNARGIITWATHNLALGSTGDLLVFRNYAIMHNNLGLQRVGPV